MDNNLKRPTAKDLLRDYLERAETERGRAETERGRAEAERGRAEAEQLKVERLAAQLRAAGIEPQM